MGINPEKEMMRLVLLFFLLDLLLVLGYGLAAILYLFRRLFHRLAKDHEGKA